MDLASRVQLGDESSSVLMDDGTFMVSRMLTIFNVAEDDAGNFTCEASSTIPELVLSPSDSRVFELVVQSKFLCIVVATFTFGLLLDDCTMLQHIYFFHVKIYTEAMIHVCTTFLQFQPPSLPLL